MGALLRLTNGLGAVNGAVLAFARWIGASAVAIMVVVILLQVFFRYILGNALAWPEEASRFLMLWMTGLMAPTAYRRSGFVGIDMLTRLLPSRLAALLALALLLLSLLVLGVGVDIAWSEVTGLQFATDSLSVPVSFDLSQWMKVPKTWMMASLLVGLILLISVAVEMILRALITVLGAGDGLRDIPDTMTMGAE